MTSTASVKSNNFATALLKVFKERLVSTILILAATLSASVIMVSYHLKEASAYASRNIDDSILVLFAVITVFIGLFSLVNSVRMFKEIYKKQSCDFYYSTPIKREEYFIANYLYGTVVNLLAYALPFINSIAMLTPSGFEFSYSKMPQLIAMVLSLMSIYTAFIMCATVAGKRIQYALLSIICLLCPSAFVAGILVQINAIWGLSTSNPWLVAVSPMENCIMSFSMTNVLPYIIVSLVEIVGMFVLGLIAFKRRKAEVAEVEIFGNVIPFIIQGVLVGAVFFEFGVSNSPVEILLGVLAAFGITVGFSAIFYKKAFTKPTLTTFAIVASACVILCACVTTPLFNGYVKYVPKAEQIESVDVTCNDNYGDETSFGFAGMLNSFAITDETSNNITLTDQENIKKVIALHERSIDDIVIKACRTKGNISIIKAIFFDEGYSMFNKSTYTITYHMSNGMEIKRSYCIDTNMIKSQITDVYQNEEALNALVDKRFNKEYLAAAVEKYYENYLDREDYGEYRTDVYNAFDVVEFKKAYMADLKNADKQGFVSVALGLPLDSTDSYYEMEQSTLQLYYVDEEAITPQNEDIVEKLRKESPQDIVNYMGINYEGKYPIASEMIQIYDSFENSIKYLDSVK